MNHDIVVFEPLVTDKASSLDRVFMAFLKKIVHTLKPRIRQIPGLNGLNLHASPPLFSRCEIEK